MVGRYRPIADVQKGQLTAKGHEKVGPVAYAQFVGAEVDEERTRLRLDASHLVKRLLQLIHEKTTCGRKSASP